jgi:hypothetical protein
VVEKGLEEKVNYDKGQSLNPRFVIAIKWLDPYKS